MKKAILLLFISINGFSQNINTLTNLKTKLKKEIEVKSDSINKIDVLISSIKYEEIKKSISDSSLIAYTKANAKIKKEPIVTSDIIITINENEKITILDYKTNGFFYICHNKIRGYISDMWIKNSDEITKYVNSKTLIEENKKKATLNNELNKIYKNEEIRRLNNKEESIARDNKYTKKYGKTTYNKLKAGYFWIGITKEMAKIALGNPSDINKTVTSYTSSEQWVYGNTFLYFENGILTSYQN